MTDIQLLELAARAAEISYIRGVSEATLGLCIATNDDEDQEWWNPLVNDGDAFRLAVALGISVSTPDDGDMVASATHWSLTRFYAEKVTHTDLYSSTRRAIVRAAAAMSQGLN